MEGVKKNGVLIGARKQINFIEGTNVTIDIDDDPSPDGDNDIDVTINASGSGGGGEDTVHRADTTDAHDASAISFDPAGTGLIATDVQDAIEEITARIPSSDATGLNWDDDAAVYIGNSGPGVIQQALESTDSEFGTVHGEIDDHIAAADPHPGYVLESLLDAKGDTIAASADNTPAKVTVGANGTLYVADSAAGAGVKWAPETGTKTVTVLNPTTGLTIMAWRAPFTCTITAVRAHFKGGTSVVYNAQLNQTSKFCSADATQSTANAWGAGTVNQNQSVAAGDDIEMMFVTITGAVTEASIQVDYTVIR